MTLPSLSTPKSQNTTGTYTIIDHSGTNHAHVENLSRSATAPEIKAGVITANIIKKHTGTSASPFRPFSPMKSKPPITPFDPRAVIENPSKIHVIGMMPMQ